jgi:hypothetical protein
MRIPGFPRPCADGRWSVYQVRRFIQKSAKAIEGPNERDRLQAELLNLKIKRAAQGLSEFEESLRAEIFAEVAGHFRRAVGTMASQLKLLPRDVAARGSGMGARQLFQLCEKLLYEGFGRATREFDAYMPVEAEPTKVVPFQSGIANDTSRHAANGSMHQ